MKGGRLTVAAAVGLVGLLAGTGLGSARAAAPAIDSQTSPATTGRALVDVRTPPLPPLGGRHLADRRGEVLAESRERLDRVVARTDLDVEARSIPGGFLTVDLEGRSIDELREKLAGDPLVRSVAPEYRAEFTYAPNDPFLYASDPHAPGGDLAGWNILRTAAETGWEIARGEGAEVAMIDSGVYAAHPELSGRITGRLNCEVGPLSDPCEGTDVTDDEGHGTHVSGLACATADNQVAIASIGFGCSIYAIKTDLTYTSIIAAIYAAVAHGSRVINMSFGGGGPSGQLRDAIQFAWASGAIPVASADNSPNPPASSNYPAQYVQPEGSGPNIDSGIGLVVTSAKHTGERSDFAQRNTGVSVAAYGSATDEISGGQQGILSTWPLPSVGLDAIGVRTTVSGDNRYAYLVGTSMATSEVAGLVALIKSVRPALAPAKLVEIVKQTASGCGIYGTGGLGWGIVRTDRAVAGAAQKDINAPSSNIRSATVAHVPGRGRVASLRLKRFDQESPCTKDIPTSGVAAVNVFASANGGYYRRIAKTKKKRIRFRAKPGRRYRFYSVAVDKAGNREGVPGIADAKFRLKKGRG